MVQIKVNFINELMNNKIIYNKQYNFTEYYKYLYANLNPIIK